MEGWWRSYKQVLAAVGLPVIAAVLGLGLGLKPEIYIPLLIVVALLAGVIAKSDLDRRRLEERNRKAELADARAKAMRQSLFAWPLPSARDMDPYSLGVAQPDVVGKVILGNQPNLYIERDIERSCRQHLQEQGCVLIIGTPNSGSSRTGIEVIRRSCPGAFVVAPIPPDGLVTSMTENDLLGHEDGHQIAIWLDRIDRHGPHLTPGFLKGLRERSSGMRIVATISLPTYRIWAQEMRELAAFFPAAELLHAELSDAEVERASHQLPGVDLRHGIAAVFNGVDVLLRRLFAGTSDCPDHNHEHDCPVARQLIPTIAGWYGTGTPRNLSERVLLQLLCRRVDPDGAEIDAAHAAAALKWATTRLPGGAALIAIRNAGGGRHYVELTETLNEMMQEKYPPTADEWAMAIDDAVDHDDRLAAGQIGYRAYLLGANVIAAQAWKHVRYSDRAAIALVNAAAKITNEDVRQLRTIRQSNSGAQIADETRHLLPLTVLLAAHEQDHVSVCQAEFLVEIAKGWQRYGYPDVARPLLENALSVCQSPEVEASSEFIAYIYIALAHGSISPNRGTPPQHTDQAREALSKGLQLLNEAHDADSRIVGMLHSGMSAVERNSGNAPEAIERARHALAIFDATSSATSDDKADALNKLLLIRPPASNLADFRTAIDRARDLLEQEIRPDNRCALLVSLSSAYESIGNMIEASTFAGQGGCPEFRGTSVAVR